MATRLTASPANTIILSAYSPSVGASPVAAYASAPCRGHFMWLACVLRGALTTADATVTITNVTTGATIGTLTLTQAGSAAGSTFGAQPSVTPIVSTDDVISITPSGASGANIAADFRLTFQAGGC